MMLQMVVMLKEMKRNLRVMLELIIEKLRENVESVKLIVNLKVVMLQKVEMLKESLRKLKILMQQIVMMLREMNQNLV